MKTIITTFNGRISTTGVIRQNGNGFSAAIIQNYSDGGDQFLQGNYYKTISGAQRYIEQYRDKKLAAYNRNELVAGVKVV